MTRTRLWCSMFSPVDPSVTLASELRPRVPTTTSCGQGRPSSVRRTRFQKAPRTTYWTAGVPARSTPQPDATAAIPARTFAGAVLVQSPDADPTDDNAVVIALGTAEDDTMARLRAGEATSLVLLTATALGLASCPIAEPLEVVNCGRKLTPFRRVDTGSVFGRRRQRSPRRVRPCARTSSEKRLIHRCCCESDGRRSTLIRCRPRRAASCRKWLHGWTVHRWADG